MKHKDNLDVEPFNERDLFYINNPFFYNDYVYIMKVNKKLNKQK